MWEKKGPIRAISPLRVPTDADRLMTRRWDEKGSTRPVESRVLFMIYFSHKAVQIVRVDSTVRHSSTGNGLSVSEGGKDSFNQILAMLQKNQGREERT